MVHIIELVGQPKVEFAQQVTVSIQIESPNEFLHRRTRGECWGGAVDGAQNDNKSCCPQSRNDNLIQIHMHTSPHTLTHFLLCCCDAFPLFFPVPLALLNIF